MIDKLTVRALVTLVFLGVATNGYAMTNECLAVPGPNHILIEGRLVCGNCKNGTEGHLCTICGASFNSEDRDCTAYLDRCALESPYGLCSRKFICVCPECQNCLPCHLHGKEMLFALCPLGAFHCGHTVTPRKVTVLPPEQEDALLRLFGSEQADEQ